ncbi:hypothetical protein GTA08_BOTSDO07967 [Neofusicoccum parvum]|uniref:Uncharacterized protein n=1 Tax=Neofusicoccum parvum TaxID=310453 RepID=A0ACB5S7P3_9PEZI|nr:hypothetical protein GTA08_BOTSDO07967 [Neofusicoccum parvum]
MDSTSAAAALRASWKLRATAEHHVTHVPLHRARQFFAVDASGSTAGRIIRDERDFAEKLHQGHPNDKAATWGTYCGDPTADFGSVSWTANRGGTQPSHILTTASAVDAIGSSDVWYLLTDGEIWENDVQVLCQLAMDTGVLNVPAIFVITGKKKPTPSDLNISVGVSFFANAPDVLILFKEVPTGHIYVVAAKGCFAPLASNGAESAPDLSSWTPLKRLLSEGELIRLFQSQDIHVPSAESRPKLSTGAINLGEQWQRENENAVVDLDLLFTAGGMLTHEDLGQLLAEEAFNNVSVACKTRGRIQDLRAFLLTQKVEEITIKLEDVSGASDIVSKLSNPDTDSAAREALQLQLREAHANNRLHYQDAMKNLRESGESQAVRQRNRLVNSALEQLAHLESSGYTADILSRRSNRAKRAATVAEGGEIPITSLDLDTPTAFRGECQICCGENEIMSVALKVGADGAANTDNFALDFPLAAGRFKSNSDLISSQNVCFQCALAFQGRSLFREDLAAVLPTLDYTGSNKKYIQEQLYIALTGGLRTGASGASQLFMTILDRTLRDKEWAGAGPEVSQDADVVQRRDMLQWVLQNMLYNTGCRETFNEQGKWVMYREALAWAVRDFRDQGIDSWAVGYPTAGFMQLVAFGQQLGAFDSQTIRDLRLAKLLHSVASAYLALLFKNAQSGNQSWKQPLLETIYTRFNIDLVPVDTRDENSLITDPTVFWTRLSAFLTADAELLADWDVQDQERLVRRIQLLAFWLVYHQREHTRAKTFFQKLRTEQPLSHSVLDAGGAPLAPTVTNPILRSIFRGRDAADQAFHARHTGPSPFATPFGPSVLRCCFAACAEPFAAAGALPGPHEPWANAHRDALRRSRADHLASAFAVDPAAFAQANQTGLPAVTASPVPPASTHYNLHVSVARAWSAMDASARRAVAAGSAEHVDAFVLAVRRKICAARRGDVFQDGLDGEVRRALPSFLEALRVALRAEGREGEGVEAFEHDWTQNNLEAKARYEMRVVGGGA